MSVRPIEDKKIDLTASQPPISAKVSKSSAFTMNSAKQVTADAVQGRSVAAAAGPTEAQVEQRAKDKVFSYCMKVGVGGTAATVAAVLLGAGALAGLPLLVAGAYLVGNASQIVHAARSQARQELQAS